MTDQKLRHLLALPFLKDLRAEMNTIEENITKEEDECDRLQHQLNQDRDKLYAAEARGDKQGIKKFDRLAAERKENLQQVKAILRTLYREREEIKSRTQDKFEEKVEELKKIATQSSKENQASSSVSAGDIKW